MNTKFVVLGCVGAAVLSAGVCGLGRFLFMRRGADGLKAEIAQGKKIGLPTTVAEFAPPVDEAKNAAPALVAAAKSVQTRTRLLAAKAKEPAASVLKFSNRPWSSSILTFADIYKPALESMKPQLSKATRAAELPSFRVDHDYSRGIYFPLTEYIDLKVLVRWLSVRATLRAKSGDQVGMARDLLTMARISAHIGSENFLIGHLVQTSTQSTTLEAMIRCLQITNGQPATVRAVRQAMAAFGPIPTLKDSMEGDYFLTRVSMDRLASGRDPKVFDNLAGAGEKPKVSPARVRALIEGTPGLLQTNAKNVLQMHRGIYSDLPEDPYAIAETKAVLTAASRKLEAQSRNLEFFFAQILTPVSVTAPEGYVRSAQHKNLLEIFLICLEERNRTGKFPTKLPAKGALATDLFDDRAIRYSSLNGKLKIYSVGVNGKDDGGRREVDRTSADADIVVSFPTE